MSDDGDVKQRMRALTRELVALAHDHPAAELTDEDARVYSGILVSLCAAGRGLTRGIAATVPPGQTTLVANLEDLESAMVHALVQAQRFSARYSRKDSVAEGD